MAKLVLKPGRQRSIRNFHPWIFSGAVATVEGNPASGDVVDVHDAAGAFLARGFFSADSQIRCRLLTWQQEEIDREFFGRKLNATLAARTLCIPPATNAYRLVNAEGDGLPGLVIDRYAEVAVMQCNTAGMDQRKHEIAELVHEVLGVGAVWERIQSRARREEGMAPVAETGGPLVGSFSPGCVTVLENGFHFEVDVRAGQKTGFYLDQRENRQWVKELASGKRVLNCFAYSGAFSIYAAAGGAARVVTVESSAPALELAKRHFRMNNLASTEEDFVLADVFAFLRATRQDFDFIILDPPAFAHHQREVQTAARAYKDVNLQAIKRLRPGGLLLSCSCSQPVSPDLFQKILFSAAADAKRHLRLIGQRGHPADHPINIFHPEGRYMQAWLLYAE